MDQQQQYRWRRIGRQILWTVGAVVAVSAVIFVLNHFFVHRPLWDWLKLLVVPAILAGGGLWFNAQQRDREQRTANERAQDEALQAYLDQMSGMLAPPSKDLPPLYRAQPGEPLSSVARARTLTVLPRLDGFRKGSVLEFLYESGLLAADRRVLDLSGADLRGANLLVANLSGADLHGVNLSKAYLFGAYLIGAYLIGADLRKANLREADLSGAELGVANLSGADLIGADLSSADLRKADLSFADLSGALLPMADLSGTDLRKANLSGTDLRKANLSETYWRGDVSKANLSGALLPMADLSGTKGITNEELAQQALSLEGATMPNGQKYEKWLEDREGRKDDAENN